MNTILKFSERINSQAELNTRHRLTNKPTQPSQVCIERWEDDGGRVSTFSSRRRPSIFVAATSEEVWSGAKTTTKLMEFASSFWGHAARETFLPAYRKVLEGVDGHGRQSARS